MKQIRDPWFNDNYDDHQLVIFQDGLPSTSNDTPDKIKIENIAHIELTTIRDINDNNLNPSAPTIKLTVVNHRLDGYQPIIFIIHY